jgi:hypothetical protein
MLKVTRSKEFVEELLSYLLIIRRINYVWQTEVQTIQRLAPGLSRLEIDTVNADLINRNTQVVINSNTTGLRKYNVTFLNQLNI